MRSYLLFCGERACAFLVGFQYGGRYLLHDLGFDPDLAKYSVGTVLQLLTVEDLFSYNRPEIFDLQEYGRYKEELSTESHIQGKIFLFRRGLYPRVLRAGHRCCRLSTQLVSTALDRLNLKSKVKKAIRRSKGAS
jgi:CelD/BcsL family acetyltransferase involved in cellulose biosynthesis